MAAHRIGWTTVGVVVAGLVVAGPARAQSLGTFRWQLQPYCNVVTVTVVQDGGQYHLDGTDDQCGATRKASVVGLAFLNPDGTIGFGLTIVTAPGGAPVHVDAEIALATLSGTWRDSARATGTFAFTPGASSGGTPRPQPSPVVPIAIRLLTDGGLLAGGAPDTGTIPATGAGVRMMWYPGRAAFRAGFVDATEWDDVNVGAYSTAFGRSNKASGPGSTALGVGTHASGFASTATGRATVAAGASSFAGGELTTAAGNWSLAFGYDSHAGGNQSVALGRSAVTTPAATGSFAFADTSSATPFGALGPNGFNARFAGGYQFYTNAEATLGAWLKKDATAWTVLSDVNVKHDFRELDGEDVLRRIAGMPVTEWSYKAQDPGVRHIGPTAQDFHAAFGLGLDPLGIETLDADGVALAGVRALEARTRALPGEVERLREENGELREALAALRRDVEVLRREGGQR